MKIIKISLSCFIILFSSCVIGQSLDSVQSNTSNTRAFAMKVDSLRKSGNLKLLIDECLLALKSDSCNPKVYYYLASTYSLVGNSDSAFIFLKKTITLDSSINYLTNPDFYSLINTIVWDSIQTIKVKHYSENGRKVKNIDLAKQLWKIKLMDQAFYYHSQIYPEKKEYYWEIKDSLNAANLKQIVAILDAYGWPKISLVGEEASSAVFLVIQHSDLSIQEKYLPHMEIAVSENEAKKSSLAYLIDRINIAKGGKQIYGTQMAFDNETGQVYFDYNNLEDIEKVNLRRKEMDLGPIEDYVALWGILWDPSEN